MIAIPIDAAEPYHDLEISLDGQTVAIHVRYSVREQRYYLHLYDAQGDAIALGVKVLCEKMLLKKRQRVSLPGQFFAHSNTIEKTPPKLGELGLPSENLRVNLFYIPAEEYAELLASDD